jgi:hypothetical protein
MSSPMFSDQPPTGRTGACPVCGGEDLPLFAGKVVDHPEQVVRNGAQANGDRHCEGSLQPPEPGTETRPPQTQRPRRRG